MEERNVLLFVVYYKRMLLYIYIERMEYKEDNL